MLCANEACGPCTAITHVVRPSIGPRASGTRLASPLRRPVVSSTTHQGATPAARRATGLKRRQNAIAIARRRACFAVMTRLSRNPATVPRRLEGTCFTMIETARLQLEPLTPEHADDLFDGLSDPRLYEFISEAPPRSLRAPRGPRSGRRAQRGFDRAARRARVPARRSRG